MPRRQIKEALALIFQGINHLTRAFPNRHFTIDGRLVGDIGEVIAALEYDLTLDAVQRRGHDARTSDGRNVQIKATFKDHLTLRYECDLYLGIKLHPNGDFEEIYNGPIELIRQRFGTRQGFGSALLSFPNKRLRELNALIPADHRVSRRQPRTDT